MLVTINKEWAINIDNYGNHSPATWKEPYTNTKGKLVEGHWKETGKYFTDIKAALSYLIEQEVHRDHKEVTLSEYMDILEASRDKLKSILDDLDG